MVTKQGDSRKYPDTSKGGGMDTWMEYSKEVTLRVLRARAGFDATLATCNRKAIKNLQKAKGVYCHTPSRSGKNKHREMALPTLSPIPFIKCKVYSTS